MNKHLFDDAIGEVPPSTVDVDAAIARGRRAAWTRRVASPVMAVAAGVLLVAGGAVALTLPDDDPVTAARVQPTGTTTQPEPTTPAGNCEPRLDDAEGQRLTDVLAGVLEAKRLLADAELTGDKPLEFVSLYAVLDAIDSCMSLHASAVVNETGRLTVLAGVAGPEGTEREPACAVGTYKCHVTYGPAGEMVINDDDPDGGIRVDVMKQDGTVIALRAEGTPLPLTVDQLREIGLDPALSIRR